MARRGAATASRPIDRLDRGGLAVGDRAAVAGELEVGQHPAYGVELRPRRRTAVGQRQPADEAVALQRRTSRRRPGEWPRARCPKPAAASGWCLPRLDPRGGSRSRRRRRAPRAPGTPPGTGSPSQRRPVGLGLEEALRRVRQRLHQRGGAVAEAQPGRGGDVAAGDRGRATRPTCRGAPRHAWRPAAAGSSAWRRARSMWRRSRAGTCVRPCPAPPRSRPHHRSTGPVLRTPGSSGSKSRNSRDPRSACDRAGSGRCGWLSSIASSTSSRPNQPGPTCCARCRDGVVPARRQRRGRARVHRLADVPVAGAAPTRPRPGRRARRRPASRRARRALGERQMLPEADERDAVAPRTARGRGQSASARCRATEPSRRTR